MRIVRALWESTRPRMFPVWLSSGLVPAIVSWRDGVFDLSTFVLETLLCYLLLTLSCWADELGDLEHGVDNEARLGPIRPLQRGVITPKEMKLACAVLAVVCVIVGVGLLAWSFSENPESAVVIVAFVISGFWLVALAFMYTMGKRPYGYRGLGDVVAFACFGPIACGVGYWLYDHSMNWAVMLPACSVGLLLTATINLQNVRDFDNDAAYGKITLACKLGKHNALLYQFALVLVSCACYLAFLPATGLFQLWRVCILLASFVPLVSHCIRFRRMMLAGDDDSRLDVLMWPLTSGMMIACLAFCAAMVL